MTTKLNIGSGPTGLSNWINLDWGLLPFLSKLPWAIKFLVMIGLLPAGYRVKWPTQLRLVDCRKKLPFSNDSVDFIFTSHFIEHLNRYDLISLISECWRVLRPGGTIRISVPDLELLASKYLAGDKTYFMNLEERTVSNDKLQNTADLFLEQFYGYDSWSRPNFFTKIQRLFIRGHLWMYDYESLSDILRSAGFLEISRCEAGSGRTPDIEELDLHKESSLFVEARK